MINQGWSASKVMNRWPTVPVAPRTPTLTVRALSSGRRVGIFEAEKWGDDFDMAAQTQIHTRQTRNHPDVSRHAPTPTTMDPNAPDSEQQQQQRLHYPPHVQANQSRIYATKFLTSCFAGAAAGILGLENFRGFGMFFFATLLSSALLWLRCKGSPKKYVPGGLVELVNPGQENLFSFLLVWTLFYGSPPPFCFRFFPDTDMFSRHCTR